MFRVKLRLNFNVFKSAQIHLILLISTMTRLITQDKLNY